MRKPTSYDSIEEALADTAQTYRKALWRDTEVYVEVWCEKDALAGVIYPVTEQYDVPLMVARGFSSETFCFEAIEAAADYGKPYIVYYLGDLDRSGRDAANATREKLERFGAERGVEVGFVHLAIAEDHILEIDQRNWRIRARIGEVTRWLPTRPHKRTSRADQLWAHEFACELDAIEPDDLRTLVRWAIEQYLPAEQLAVLQIAEASEREQIRAFVADREDDSEDDREDDDEDGLGRLDHLHRPARHRDA